MEKLQISLYGFFHNQERLFLRKEGGVTWGAGEFLAGILVERGAVRRVSVKKWRLV